MWSWPPCEPPGLRTVELDECPHIHTLNMRHFHNISAVLDEVAVEGPFGWAIKAHGKDPLRMFE